MPDRTVRRPLGVIGQAPALASLLVGLLVALALLGTGAGSSQAAPIDPPTDLSRAVAAAEASAAPDAAEPARPVTGTDLLAHVDGLELFRPADDLVVAGFHEANTPGSLPLEPVGDRATILPSRGRGSHRSSAVDIVLVDEEPVLAPVSGEVVEATNYTLYGRHADKLVTIEPEGRADLHVVLLHMEGLQVEVGDEVEAGTSVIANGARQLPFRSQVDRETAPDAWPHLHLEVRPAA